LKEVDLIACEDTRHTRRLLDHFNIIKPMISYHEHNEQSRAAELVARIEAGESVAIVTDAGSPGISDPAYRVVCAAIEAGISVIPIPGVAALIAGLTASGLPTDSFLFAGFLPNKRGARRSRLEELENIKSTLVFYETPHRIREALKDILEILGDRRASLARELTKLHEQFIRGTVSEVIDQMEKHEPRGEMTLVIAGNRDDNSSFEVDGSISEQVESLMSDNGLSRTEAIKAAARSRGMTRREAYQIMLGEKEEDEIDID
jgi:16S rRNA (cytidine1402-2'-O)-methyltransferase